MFFCFFYSFEKQGQALKFFIKRLKDQHKHKRRHLMEWIPFKLTKEKKSLLFGLRHVQQHYLAWQCERKMNSERSLQELGCPTLSDQWMSAANHNLWVPWSQFLSRLRTDTVGGWVLQQIWLHVVLLLTSLSCPHYAV